LYSSRSEKKKKVLKEAKILVTLSLSTLGHFLSPTWHAFEGSTLPHFSIARFIYKFVAEKA